MFIFLFLSVLYLGAWSVMFFSTTFRWTFITWRFFSVMASVSVFLTISCLAMGVLCRFNFGKGLIRYRKRFLLPVSIFRTDPVILALQWMRRKLSLGMTTPHIPTPCNQVPLHQTMLRKWPSLQMKNPFQLSLRPLGPVLRFLHRLRCTWALASSANLRHSIAQHQPHIPNGLLPVLISHQRSLPHLRLLPILIGKNLEAQLIANIVSTVKAEALVDIRSLEWTAVEAAKVRHQAIIHTTGLGTTTMVLHQHNIPWGVLRD